MATLQVQSNGSAPSNAKVGDHIITAGGTYQVLDGSQYQGKSAEELASAGVGYNPTSGLYSKKISDVTNFTGKAQSTIPQLSLRNSDTARQWANTQNQKVSADLDSAYYQNRQDAYNSYMDAITRQNQQANDVNASYLDNISRLYDNTYQNNNAVLERMASKGLTSSGLGNAMQVAALADASKKNADLRFQRNRDLNNIETEMNNLTNQYNINLDTLAKKLRSDKISALSQNEVAFLEAMMAIEEGNANAENSASMMQYQLANEAEQAMLQREFQASESELDRQFQREMQAASLGGSGGGYGGYGGYRRGGYSGRGYGRYGGYGSGGVGYGDMTLAEYYAGVALSGENNHKNLSKASKARIQNEASTGITPYAVAAISDAKKQQRGEVPVSSQATKDALKQKSDKANKNNQKKTQSGRSTGLTNKNKNKQKSNKNKTKSGRSSGLKR